MSSQITALASRPATQDEAEGDESAKRETDNSGDEVPHRCPPLDLANDKIRIDALNRQSLVLVRRRNGCKRFETEHLLENVVRHNEEHEADNDERDVQQHMTENSTGDDAR